MSWLAEEMCGAKVEPLFPSAYAQLCTHAAFPSILPSFITMLLFAPPPPLFSLFPLPVWALFCSPGWLQSGDLPASASPDTGIIGLGCLAQALIFLNTIFCFIHWTALHDCFIKIVKCPCYWWLLPLSSSLVLDLSVYVISCKSMRTHVSALHFLHFR